MSLLEPIIIASLLTVSLWLPHLMAASLTRGIASVLSGNPRKDTRPLPGWAMRSSQAHQNALENLTAFIAVCMVAHIAGLNSAELVFAAYAYCLARIAHYLCYVFAVPILRTTFFLLSWISIVYIGYISFISL